MSDVVATLTELFGHADVVIYANYGGSSCNIVVNKNIVAYLFPNFVAVFEYLSFEFADDYVSLDVDELLRLVDKLIIPDSDYSRQYMKDYNGEKHRTMIHLDILRREGWLQ